MGCLICHQEVPPNHPNFHHSSPAPENIHFTYNFYKAIGFARYGTVRLASRKNRPNDLVAIKSIVKRKLRTSTDRLEAEIHILFSLDHPNIIKLYEVFEDNDYIHLVTEYCAGGELMERLMLRGKYDEAEAAHLLQKVFRAVNNLHHNDICHRDLRPHSFLFLTPAIDAELKLINFGVSNKYCLNSARTTIVGKKSLGSAYYAAPEVVQGGHYDIKCDIWSLGVIMYVMLTGKMPFAGSMTEEISANIQSGSLILRDKAWKGLSTGATDLLKKLLVVEPEGRLSAEEALKHPWLAHSWAEPSLQPDQEVLDSLRSYQPKNRFQAEIYAMMVKYLHPKKTQDLQATFMTLDRKKTGFISLNELQQGLQNAGYNLTSHQIAEILSNADFKKDGRINYSEFLAATLKSRALVDEDLLWRAFTLLDVDRTGCITSSNVQAALKRAGRKTEEATKMMEDIGASQAGLTYEQFKAAMRH